MNWLRDVLLALLWAVVAASLSVALEVCGLVAGFVPILLPLVAAPMLAFRWHRSRRIAWLVAAWVLVLAAAGILYLVWEFRDFQFRAPGR